MIFNQVCVSLIGERRICYPKFEIPDIAESCTYEIVELQEILVTKEIHWELLVYGPDRAWHRYLVLPDSLEALKDDEYRSGTKRIKATTLLVPYNNKKSM